jgi:hypothetical protein
MMIQDLVSSNKRLEFNSQFEQELIRTAMEQSFQTPLTWTKSSVKALPSKVDYTPFIPFVRHQGGYGCGMYSQCACWDIQNEMNCAYSPNLSVNRLIWAWNREIHKETIPGIGVEYTTLDEYLLNFGVPTEGTELTNSNAVQWPTAIGNSEAPNYRMASLTTPVKVDLNEFKTQLTYGPLRIGIWGNHFVALIGYDDAKGRFKFINSWGDQWGEQGYGYVEYSKLNQEVQSGNYYNFKMPLSIPSAIIRFNHTYRQSVYLWLGVEGRTTPIRIWPNGQNEDQSKNLTLKVALPLGFIWSPQSGNRVYLDVYDSGGPFESGGDLLQFTAAFCGQTVTCTQLAKGPVHFNPYQVTRFYIP